MFVRISFFFYLQIKNQKLIYAFVVIKKAGGI